MSWGEPVADTGTGVYLVALSPSAREFYCPFREAPLSGAAFAELVAACPQLKLDGCANPSAEQVAGRIASYWLPDETVLYIGLAGQPLRTRVRQYYNTPLGAIKPHKGGWWLKTLSVLSDLHVHFARTSDFKNAEETMLRSFASNVSGESLERVPGGEALMPFANLRDADWRRRNHGITGATSARLASAGSKRSTRPRPAMVALETERLRQRAPERGSPRVTAVDIEAGRIRVPRGATKASLPPDRAEIFVVLRGHPLGGCRWDPRYGPPERSGVITIGRAAARQLLADGDVLTVRVGSSSAVQIL